MVDVDTERHLADGVFVIKHQRIQHQRGRLQLKHVIMSVSNLVFYPQSTSTVISGGICHHKKNTSTVSFISQKNAYPIHSKLRLINFCRRLYRSVLGLILFQIKFT